MIQFFWVRVQGGNLIFNYRRRAMESVVVAQSGEDANKTAEQMTAPEEIELFVGDFLEFTGGEYNGIKGMIYYLDEDLLRLLPVGAPHTVIDIPTTIFGEEDIEFKREKSELKTFVDIVSLKEGNLVQTYLENGIVGPIYKVQSVNLEEDSVVLEEQDGSTLAPIQFTVDGRVVGIPREESFVVMRSQEAPKEFKSDEQEEEEENEEEEIELIEEPIVEAPEDIVIGKIRAEFISYKEDVQKNDFIKEEIAALKPEKRNNLKLLQRIQRLMENANQLRKDILEYEDSEVIGFKPITYETLAKLLQQTDFALAKPVLNVFKTLYLDHSPQYFDKENPQPDPTDYKHKAIDIQYLQDAVEGGIAYLKREFGPSMEIGGIKDQLPKFYTVLQPFYDTYFQVIGPLDADERKPIEFDRDFFRVNPMNTPEPALLGLPSKQPNASKAPVTIDSITQISQSYMRAIAPRLGKYGDKKTKMVGIVEQGDEAEIWLFILFPFLFLRDLGAIRSGKLAIDIGNGLSRPKTMSMILEEGGGIREISDKGAILAVDPEGKHAANIELKDWFMGQEIYGNGLGDLLPFLRSIGLDSAEFTPDQQSILLKKIQFYQASLKNYINTIRQEANKILESPSPVVSFSLLAPAEQALFLEALVRDEVVLKETAEEFKLKYPSWAENDLGIFSYVYLKYPDYVLACLANLPTLPLERKRAADDKFLKRVHEALLLQQKAAEESDVKEVNNCDHVKNLSDIRKIENEDQRIQVMIQKFLPTFRGPTVNNWIECRVCNQHLICEHEYLLILEKTHPLQKDLIHKKILTTFSDGVFNGKFICGVCGQAIQELDYDQNPEFDDNGNLMMGNQPITQEMETTFSKEIEKLLDVKEETFTEKPKLPQLSDEQKRMRMLLLNEMATAVGISLPLSSFERMMTLVDRMLLNNLSSQEDYTREIEEEKKKNPKVAFPNYTEYKNQEIIINCAAALFLEIQSAIPSLMIKTVVSGCGDPTFDGYPLIQDDSQIEGVTYMSCCVTSLIRNERPWAETYWSRMSSSVEGMKRRKASVLRLLMAALQSLLRESEVQKILEAKREYIVQEKGIQALTGRYADQIPNDFLPVKIQPTEELLKKATEPLIGDAATPRQRAFAWLLQGYRLARTNGVYEAGNPLSEATCCYSVIRTPMGFWLNQSELPRLYKKQPPRGPRGSTLVLKMKPRPAENIFASPDPMLMYRLFLSVCFPREGIVNPRVGLPHEPGYDNKCPYCLFEFPVDPRLPPPTLSYSKEKKVQEQFDKEYQTEVKKLYDEEINALQKAGAIEGSSVRAEQFEELLEATNRHFILPRSPVKSVSTDLQTLDGLLTTLQVEPFPGFLAILAKVREEVSRLPRTEIAADAPEVYLAYAAISAKQKIYEDKIVNSIKTAYTDEKKSEPLLNAWNQLWNASPQVLGELLRTFLLLPFQRMLLTNYKPFTITDKKTMMNRKAIYSKIALEERKKLEQYLDKHIDQVVFLKEEMAKVDAANKATVQKKIEEFVQKLSVYIPLLIKVLRANVLPFGTTGLPYIQRAILGGLFWEFMNPTVIGGKNHLRKMLFICLLKSQEKDENTILTAEDIQKILTDSKESEKVKIIDEFDKMGPAEKRAELVMKTLGIGRWARGGAKGIMSYDEEQQQFEAADREDRGLTDFYGLSAVQQKARREEIDAMKEGDDYYAPDGDEET
jgi:hypothetical protein